MRLSVTGSIHKGFAEARVIEWPALADRRYPSHTEPFAARMGFQLNGFYRHGYGCR